MIFFMGRNQLEIETQQLYAFYCTAHYVMEKFVGKHDLRE